MKPIANRDPFKVGIVTLLALALLGVGIVVLSVASFGTTSYSAVLQHTAGLRTGEDVQVHGVSVGEVTDIELRDRDVLVTFDLDSEIDLGAETSAEVKVATLLGTHYLQVEPAGGGELADGRIPIDRTAVPYNLQDVIEGGAERLDADVAKRANAKNRGGADDRVSALDPDLLADALAEISTTLGRSGDDLGPALEGVGELSRLVTKRSGQTQQLLRSARAVTDQLDASKGDLIGLMESTNLVVAEVTSRREAIRRLFTETSSLSEALQAIVDQTDADIGPALRDLDLALDTLNKQDKQLKRVLDVMAPAFRYVANATGSGPFGDLYVDPPAIPADDGLCARGDCP